VSESGLIHDDLENGPIFGTDEDPVRRWREIVTAYSGLELTYSKDRLPAIAAIVRREMRLRKADTYIAGTWESSLLIDLLWYTNDTTVKRLPRLSNSVPTWSWPSLQAIIYWHSGKMVPSLTLVDISFTRLGPAHVGEVIDASITLEGPTCMTRLTRVGEAENELPGFCMEIVSPPCEGAGVFILDGIPMDFDWTTGDRPVSAGDTFLVILIHVYSDDMAPCSRGLTLRQVSDDAFERMGFIKIHPVREGRGSRQDHREILSDFVDALPIRQVKII